MLLYRQIKVVVYIVLGFSLLFACKPEASKQSGGEAVASGPSDGDATPEPAIDSNSEDGENPFQEYDETKKPKPPSLATILNKECGIANPLDTNEVILDQRMVNPYQRVLTSGLLDVYIDLHTTIIMKNTQARSDFTIELDVIGANADFQNLRYEQPDLVLQQAESEAIEFRGTTSQFTLADENNPLPEEWEGYVCTVSFATRAITTVGGFETEMTFTPPLPTGVSPTPIPERFESELGRGKHFHGIVAEIIRTNNPRLSVGQKIQGSVFIERRPSTRATPAMDLKGDVTYRTTNFFKDRRTTADLGMLLWAEVYIDHETQEYQNFASDLGTDLQYLYKEGNEPFPSTFGGDE